MKYLFTPEHIVVNDLFGDDMKYIIPGYQRRYEWDCLGKSERNNQINLMWNDLYDFFESKTDGEYFLGSMVMLEKNNREFEVIDGQQRLTSLVTLFASIKCFLKIAFDKTVFSDEHKKTDFEQNFKLHMISFIDSKIFNPVMDGAFRREKKVRIESSIVRVNYDNILLDVLECKDDNNDFKDDDKVIASRYFRNRNYFVNQFEQHFLDENGINVELAQKLNSFIEFLKNRVSIVRIKAYNLPAAFMLFEILNNRGLPLSNKDLLRNFIIRKFDEIDYSEPVEKWNELELNGISDEFISRWVESRNAKQQKYSAFTEIENIYKDKYADTFSQKSIELFHSNLISDLYNFQLIKNERLPFEKNRIKFLLLCGNEKYTINLLLSLLRVCKIENLKIEHYSEFFDDNSITIHRKIYKREADYFEICKKDSEFIQKQDFINLKNYITFLIYYEQYVLYTMLKPNEKFSSSVIYKTINALNNNNFDLALKTIEIPNTAKDELSELLNGEIRNNDIATLLIIKYFWLTQNPDDVGKFNLDINKVTLEHIIPRKPRKNSNWELDFSAEFRDYYTYRLGNMTLLTLPMNATAGNSDIKEKLNEYEKSDFPLNIEIALATKASITENFIEDRNYEILRKLYSDLCIKDITQIQITTFDDF